jgi:elongation factor P
MSKASELKKGAIVEINGAPHMLEELSIQTPSARGSASLYKLRFRNLVSKQKVDQTCKGDHPFADIDFEQRPAQFSYMQGDNFVFMDSKDFSEVILTADDVGDQKYYITEELEGLRLLMSNGRVLGLELPPTVELNVDDCGPSIKGASATARTKPATLTTGLVVQVPEYMARGERVRVDTRTGKFLGRA